MSHSSLGRNRRSSAAAADGLCAGRTRSAALPGAAAGLRRPPRGSRPGPSTRHTLRRTARTSDRGCHIVASAGIAVPVQRIAPLASAGVQRCRGCRGPRRPLVGSRSDGAALVLVHWRCRCYLQRRYKFGGNFERHGRYFSGSVGAKLENGTFAAINSTVAALSSTSAMRAINRGVVPKTLVLLKIACSSC